MYPNKYNVFLVDDDQDMLNVTKLAIKHMQIDGLPIEIYTASSKAEAIHLLNTSLSSAQGETLIHVAVIDIVMETDQAGLELCDYIRETMGNTITTIYVRTGQPGIAPERSVIDQYNISGYFTKVESTDDKLYSLVSAGARTAQYAATAQGMLQLVKALISVSATQAGIGQLLQFVMGASVTDMAGVVHETVDSHLILTIDGQLVGNRYDLPDDQALAHISSLADMDGSPLGGNGDKYVMGHHELLIYLKATETSAEVCYLARVPGMSINPNIIKIFYAVFQSVGMLWHLAQERAIAM